MKRISFLVVVLALVAGLAVPWAMGTDVAASPGDLTISVPTLFTDLDGSASDDDGTVDGVLTVNGTLTIATGGSITYNDPASPANASAGPISINVTGNMEMQAGSFIEARNTVGGGSGGTITILIGGDLLMAGAGGGNSGARIDNSADGNNNAGTSITINVGGNMEMGSGSIIKGESAQNGSGTNISIAVGGDLTLDGSVVGPPAVAGALVSSSVLGGSGGNAGSITINVGNCTATPPTGDIVVDYGAVIKANSAKGAGGAIVMNACRHIDMDGLIESASGRSGTGAVQGPGGGPITLDANCDLTISDTGVVRSKGQDPGADLIHLEGGCDVLILGLVESTGVGHAIPNSPPNHLNSSYRPDKPANSTTGVEVWAGNYLLIDSVNANGEVDADGGPGGRGWIDLFCRGDIEIIGDSTAPFAVHANRAGGTDQTGGNVTVKSTEGKVTASGLAVQADGNVAGGTGGAITVEAALNVTLDTATVFARGDFTATGGYGKGGQVALRSFNQTLGWQNGVGDVQPTGTGITAANRGAITLQDCTAGTINTSGTSFPVTSGSATTPTELADTCGGAPTLQSYVMLPPCSCEVCHATLTIIKVVDGMVPAGDWEFTSNITGHESFTLPAAGGNVTFDPVAPGTYNVTEVPKIGYQTTPSNPQQIVVGACENAEVTFTNTCHATLKVIKVVNGAVPAGDWEFTSNITGHESFTLPAAGGNVTFHPVDPGTYNVTEVAKAGYNITPSNPQQIVVGACENAEVTFTNTHELGCLNVTKVIDKRNVIDGSLDDLAEALFSVNITGPSYPDGTILEFKFEDGVLKVYDGAWVEGNSYCLCSLIPGNYTATEAPAAGWEAGNITGSPALVAAGDACAGVDITVTNQPTPGCLDIQKVVDAEGLAGDVPDALFDVEISGPSYPSGETVTFNLTDGVLYVWDNDLEQWIEGDSYCLCRLIPGNYTAAETPPAGWAAANVTGSPATVEAGDECGGGVVLASAPFGMTNPGFGSGNLTGWDVDTGSTGSAGVFTFYEDYVDNGDCSYDVYVSYDPVCGDYFALLEPGTEDEPTTISQNFTIDAGETLEAWVFWVSGECMSTVTYVDYGSLDVYQGATLVESLFYANTTAAATAWTDASWTAPSSGTYTLVASVVNVGDSDVPSFLGLDICEEGAGGDFDITVTNAPEMGCLDIQKVVDPEGLVGDVPDALFDVDIGGPSYPDGEELTVTFNLTGGDLYVYNGTAWVEGDSYCLCGLLPGNYTAAEVAPDGWEDAVIDPETGFIVVADSECDGDFDITVTNTPETGCLDIQKVVDAEGLVGDVPDAVFDVDIGGPSYPSGFEHTVTFNLTGGDLYVYNGTAWVEGDSYCLCGLLPGNYTASEAAPDGWEDAIIDPETGFIVVAHSECGGDFDITVTNTPEMGCLDLQKAISLGTYGVAPDALFDVEISGPSYPAGFEHTVSFNLTGGDLYVYNGTAWVEGDSYCLCGLLPGNYTAAEVAPAGWEDAIIDPETGFIVVADSECGGDFDIMVTNTPKARIQVIKYTDGVCSTSVDWPFELSGGDLSSPIGDSSNHTIPDCELDFGGANLTPDVTYTLCEYVGALPTAGWAVNGTWQISGDPSGPTPISFTWNPVSQIYCTDFSAGAGETIIFIINNISPPGGGPRTPGYWKNWTKCDGRGMQAETAAKNGGWEAGFWLLDDIIGPYPGSTNNSAAAPILIGDLLVDTCEEGVAILDMRDVVSGKAKGGDAAFMLARNLLAAYLNYGAGACTDPDVTNAMAQGQALLDTANFDGTGNYWKGGKNAAANRATALSLADILDDYNNGMYCS